VETSLTLVVRPSTLVVRVEGHEHDSVPLPKNLISIGRKHDVKLAKSSETGM
jgi:hypothetical protein